MAVLSVKNGTKSRSLLVGNAYFQPTSFESIATAVGTGSNSSITFSSIPSTFKHLQVRAIVKNDIADTSISSGGMAINGDNTNSNYAYHQLDGDGSTVSASGTSNSRPVYGRVPQANYTNIVGATIIDIQDYASTTKNKTIRIFDGCDTNSTNGYIELRSGLWMSTSAVNSLTFYAHSWSSSFYFTTATTFALYGIKG